MQVSRVRGYQGFRWAGDEIVHDPIVPAARRVPVAKGKRGYDVDIREFLGLGGSALLRRELEAVRDGLSSDDRMQFQSRKAGAFDFRVQAVTEHLRQTLRYMPGSRRADSWLVPSETLANRGGDCEDIAFLLAALLEQSGISGYCLRVAFGTVTETRPDGTSSSWHHAWVAYLDEGGAWEILEPLAMLKQRSPPKKKARGKTRAEPRPTYEYRPHFVLNRDHLWRVRSSDTAATQKFSKYVAHREFFDSFDPTFATSVHNSIYRDALAGVSSGDLGQIERASFMVDANTLAYDPRDHFDFAYIAEGWSRVRQRLLTGGLNDLGLALHAIGDFYAHSTYADFGARRSGTQALVPYNPVTKRLAVVPVYDFSPYLPIPGTNKSALEAARPWQGKIISGQWWRWFTTYPDDIQGKAELALRRTLPDHDTISVDDSARKDSHRRYDEAEFAFQFADRRAAAVEHMRAVWQKWHAKFR